MASTGGIGGGRPLDTARFEYNGSVIEFQGTEEQIDKLNAQLDSISSDTNSEGLRILSAAEYARLVGRVDNEFGTSNTERLVQVLSSRLGSEAGSFNIRKTAQQMRVAQASTNPDTPQQVSKKAASDIYKLLMFSKSGTSLGDTTQAIIDMVSALPLPPEDKAHLLTVAQNFAPDRTDPQSSMARSDPGSYGRQAFDALEAEKQRLVPRE